MASMFDNLIDNLKEQLEDLYYVQVITTSKIVDPKAGDDSKDFAANLASEDILARTIIELDGDIIAQLPGTKTKNGKFVVDEEILKVHQETVTVAVQNWNNLLNMMIQALETLARIAGVNVQAKQFEIQAK